MQRKGQKKSFCVTPALLNRFETRLLQAFKAKFSHVHVFQRMFDAVPDIARQLGTWCADEYIVGELSDKKMRKYEIKTEQQFYARSTRENMHKLDDRLAELRSAFEFVQEQHTSLRSTLGEVSSQSSKVRELQIYLGHHFAAKSSHRCIVFVDRRRSARLLAALFKEIGTQHMRSAFLVGSNTTEIGEDGLSFRQQVMTLIKFRHEELNCLFATSVAEEGLDVPDCNLVVRFDMYNTMIEYVQSRGRARQTNSRFIHMVETGNAIHNELVCEIRLQEQSMRRFCQALPEDRRLLGNEDSLEALMDKEKTLRVYTDPLTGAKLTYGNSLAYLANFVSAIPTAGEEPQHPTYIVSSQGSRFISEVLLPDNRFLRSAIGRICTKKALAKRSAAFDACIELRKKGGLNEHLMPTIHKQRPAMRNALLAVGMAKTNQYTMRTKPSVWEQTRGSLPMELFITIIDFPDGLERDHQPLAMLTRTQMPDFPAFPVFLNNLLESKVASRRVAKSMKISHGALAKLSAFTFRIFKDVFNKKYEEHATELSYWLAPAKGFAMKSLHAAPENALDWKVLDEVFENDQYFWTAETPHDFLSNRFLFDKWDGGRRLYTVAVAPELKPLDPVPENTAKARFAEDILRYSSSLFKESYKKRVWDLDQPVLEAEKVMTRRNMLATLNPKETSLKTKAFVCPEPLQISAIPVAVAVSCFVWPAVLWRLEAYLVALEACSVVGVTCEPRVALAAMTKDSDNSGEHDNQECINFQKGMGENYERLEFIGDTFLKTATTISTFIQNPDDNEDELHVNRMLLLCNKNLFKVARELKLYEFIRSMAFSRRLWYPEGLKLEEGKGKNKKPEDAVVKHTLAEKTIADVCEALIGAAFVTHDKPGEVWHENQWDNAVHAVAILVGNPQNAPGHAMKKWNDYRVVYQKPAYQTEEATTSHKDLAEKVELEHPYRFRYPRLLRSAFNHPSQPWLFEKLPSYQRLEFLGDALLDMASIAHIFYRYPDKDPQWLTEHKMAMVSNKFLGALCVNIGFHKHLRYASSMMEHQIREYATELLEAKQTAGDGRDYWTTVSDPPKCLPDIVESYVGAMFIDSDFDYNAVQNFFDTQMKWYFEDISMYDTFANNHPCTHLHNLLDTTYGCQDYRVMAQELPVIDGFEMERKDIVAVVMVHNEIIACSKGKSGGYARMRAAKDAIATVQGLAPIEFRSKFGCDCHLRNDNPAAEEDKVASAIDCSI